MNMSHRFVVEEEREEFTLISNGGQYNVGDQAQGWTHVFGTGDVTAQETYYIDGANYFNLISVLLATKTFNTGLINGDTYRASFDVTDVNGTVTMLANNGIANVNISSPGSYSFVFTASDPVMTFSFFDFLVSLGGNAEITVDNFVLEHEEEVTQTVMVPYNVYRYGFQGQERDDEIKGSGNSYNYTYRMHDPRLGRFFAVDPMYRDYPELTPYQFSSNSPIGSIEIEGLEGGELSTPFLRIFGLHFYKHKIPTGGVKRNGAWKKSRVVTKKQSYKHMEDQGINPMLKKVITIVETEIVTTKPEDHIVDIGNMKVNSYKERTLIVDLKEGYGYKIWFDALTVKDKVVISDANTGEGVQSSGWKKTPSFAMTDKQRQKYIWTYILPVSLEKAKIDIKIKKVRINGQWVIPPKGSLYMGELVGVPLFKEQTTTVTTTIIKKYVGGEKKVEPSSTVTTEQVDLDTESGVRKTKERTKTKK